MKLHTDIAKFLAVINPMLFTVNFLLALSQKNYSAALAWGFLIFYAVIFALHDRNIEKIKKLIDEIKGEN